MVVRPRSGAASVLRDRACPPRSHGPTSLLGASTFAVEWLISRTIGTFSPPRSLHRAAAGSLRAGVTDSDLTNPSITFASRKETQ